MLRLRPRHQLLETVLAHFGVPAGLRLPEGSLLGSRLGFGPGLDKCLAAVVTPELPVIHAVNLRTGIPAFSASDAQCDAPGEQSRIKATHRSAPSFTISALRMNPARLPCCPQSAGCGSAMTSASPGWLTAQACAIPSAPAAPPWTTVSGPQDLSSSSSSASMTA